MDHPPTIKLLQDRHHSRQRQTENNINKTGKDLDIIFKDAKAAAVFLTPSLDSFIFPGFRFDKRT